MQVEIKQIGDPCLLAKSVPITESEFGSAELLQLIQHLRDTQKAAGGVGIAAPQIGVNKRVIVIEYYQHEITRYSDTGDCDFTVIINPELTIIGDEVSVFNEGCLSVRGFRGRVTRPKSIGYKYYDEFGVPQQGCDSGFFARVLQHEYDHLEGILYPMRLIAGQTLEAVDAIS